MAYEEDKTHAPAVLGHGAETRESSVTSWVSRNLVHVSQSNMILTYVHIICKGLEHSPLLFFSFFVPFPLTSCQIRGWCLETCWSPAETHGIVVTPPIVKMSSITEVCPGDTATGAGNADGMQSRTWGLWILGHVVVFSVIEGFFKLEYYFVKLETKK